MNIDEEMEKMRSDLGLPRPPGAALTGDELMRRVQAEVARKRQPADTDTAAAEPGQPARADLARWVPSAERLPYRKAYALPDLLSFSDLDFVDQCYRIVLRRAPDRAGLDHYVAQLRLGHMSKVEVLGEMRFSPEGMSRGVHVDGLLIPYRMHRIMKWPLVGPVLRWCHGLLRLGSQATRLQQLDAAQAREAHCLGHTLNRVAAQLDERGADAVLSLRRDLDNASREARDARMRLESRTAAMEALLPQLAKQDDLRRAMEITEARASALEALLPQFARRDELRDARDGAEARTAALEALLPQYARQDELREAREGAEARVAALEALLPHYARQDELRDARERVEARAAALEAALPQLASREGLDAGLNELRALAGTLQEQLRQASTQADVERLQGVMQSSLDELRHASEQLAQRIGVGEQALAVIDEGRRKAQEASSALDPFYAAFEDRFRGSRELVRTRVEPYLAWMREVGAGTREAPVLDLGCGRGEWLELLRDHHMYASGIDLNSTFIEVCRGRGLEVQHADVMDGLSGRADQSVGAVTSMHLVEHLPLDVVVALIDEARRVLRPGGLLVLETPNPENLRVGAHWFYLDPTHRNPIPPDTLRWLVESRGFQAARIERLTHGRDMPWPGRVADDLPGAETINAMSDQFVAAPDYAIVAVRP